MNDSLSLAKSLLLGPSSIDDSQIQKVMNVISKTALSDADLFFQTSFYESWQLEDSQVKSGSYSIDKGVGIRAVSEDKTGFAYSDDIALPSMLRAAKAARTVALDGKIQTKPLLIKSASSPCYQGINPIDSMSKLEKIALLELIDKTARAQDARVIQVNASLSSSYEATMVAGIHQEMVADIRPLVSIQVTVMVEDKTGRRESARSGGGGRVALQWFQHEDRALHYAKEAVREALINLG